MDKQHAKLAPSSAETWMNCTGSIALCEGIERRSSVYADEGTAAHDLAAKILRDESFEMTDAIFDMIDDVKVYTNAILNAAEGKLLLVEQRVPISHITGEEGACGTSDAIIIDVANRQMEVHDLKFGKGVLVVAEENPQLQLYALGALKIVESAGYDVDTIKVVIHQPRRDHVSEWELTREKLLEFGTLAVGKAMVAHASKPGENLNPSEAACRWCPAKAVCPALREKIDSVVSDEFAIIQTVTTDEKPLAAVPDKSTIEMVRDWVNAVEDHIYAQLTAGRKVDGWKLVQGRKGNRVFANEQRIVQYLRGFKFNNKDFYVKKLKSPAQIEKLVTDAQWGKLQPFITQPDGKPVAVESADKRPEYTPVDTSEFQNLDLL